VRIREVSENDAPAIAAIYAHHVVNGTASFDYEPPPVDFHSQKIRRIAAARWPFLVAEDGEALIGYAYLTQFRDRDGYRFTAEDSIYVHPKAAGRGVGTALLSQLLDRGRQRGFRTIVAVVGGAEPASIGLHAKCGFKEVGRLHGVGWKHDRWLDSVYMQVELQPPPAAA
jgi:phosphinothricin acetyltransferase